MMRKIEARFRRRIVISLVGGALFVTFGVVSIILQGGVLGLITYFAGMVATAVLIGLSVWLSVRIWYNRDIRYGSPTTVGSLLSALRSDPDAGVRLEAAKGLAELDVERSSLHEKHGELDKGLISALEHDPDPRVRAEAAGGLAGLELEKSSYDHKYD
jgi:hypothetical protein